MTDRTRSRLALARLHAIVPAARTLAVATWRNRSGWEARIATIIRHPLFERFIIAVIAVNAVTLGLETSKTVMDRFGAVLEFVDGPSAGAVLAGAGRLPVGDSSQPLGARPTRPRPACPKPVPEAPPRRSGPGPAGA